VLYTVYPARGALGKNKSKSKTGQGVLQMYDLNERKEEYIVSGLRSFVVSRKKGFVIYWTSKDLRILKAGDKPDNNTIGFNKKNGWLVPNRAKVAVNPPDEWQQMLKEAWRLQRDHFWTEDMSHVDWQKIYERYQALLGRVTTRSEFSDLVWEMQGELGTSHAYEYGGDYRHTRHYRQGFLGADFEYDPESDGYRITHIVTGDTWLEEYDSPLNRLGTNIKVGDILLGIDGQRLSQEISPQKLLINQANSEVQLLLANGNQESEVVAQSLDCAESQNEDSKNVAQSLDCEGKSQENELPKTRRVLVKTLRDETKARYREWVETNRQWVYEKTDGQIGYLHIPDMGVYGFAEFHRYYLAECERQGLIIDVRFNRGGNVSQLLLEKLTKRRLGYDLSRYGKPSPFPSYSMLGPMVLLANEYTASDGDIFTHTFKMLKLGSVIGKRTWGGVIGIWPRHLLVDGTTTSQPEFSSWFEDVGWRIENYGTAPDIEVDIKPQDYAANEDTQLLRGVQEILKILKQNPLPIPDFGSKPNLVLPKLP
jgi:tricorn protease